MPVVETTPHGNREPKELGLPVAVAPSRASLSSHRLRRGIDVDAAHLRQIDDEAAVVHRVARDVVGATLDREQQLVLTREVDGVDDVCRPSWLHDQGRFSVEEPVPDRAGVVVAGIAGAKHVSPDALNEPLKRFLVDRRFGRDLASHCSSSPRDPTLNLSTNEWLPTLDCCDPGVNR